MLRIMNWICIAAIIFVSSFSYGQIMEDVRINEHAVFDWIADDMRNYEGVYFFGTSESESTVFIAVEENMMCVQVLNYVWTDVGNGHSDWRPVYQNYHNVKIVDNNFYSDETNGTFVIYKNGSEKIYGLKLMEPPNGNGTQYEIGVCGNKNKLEYLNGIYRQTKFDIIPLYELEKLTSYQLMIMRNEIYARYGYLFKKGGNMDRYFREQDWYIGLTNNTDSMLTEIEKENIKRIKQIEAIKKN